MKHGTEAGWVDGCTCHACYLAGRIPSALDAETVTSLSGMTAYMAVSASSASCLAVEMTPLPKDALDLRRAA